MSRAIASRDRIRGSLAPSLLCAWLSLFGLCGLARAESAQRALGFSRLIERTESDTPLRFGQEAYRAFILDQLRGSGLRAIGGEDAVFERDESGLVELVLGGTVTEYQCQRFSGTINCRIGVRWQVLDVRSNQVIYETLARAGVYRIRPQESVLSVGQQLLAKALASLLHRPRFTTLLASDASPEAEPASLLAAPEDRLPTDEPDAMPSLDPDGDQRRLDAAAEVKRRTALFDLQQRQLAAQERADEELARRTPAYVSALKWGGVALGSFGLIAVMVSQASYDHDTTTKKDFETLRLWNDLGWASVAVGGGSFAASFLLAPRLPSAKSADGRARAELPSPLLVGVQGRY